MLDKYSLHDQRRDIWKKRTRKKSQFADMHKRGLISTQYENVYKRTR